MDVITYSPFGLFIPLAIFARSLFGATPAEPVRPVLLNISLIIAEVVLYFAKSVFRSIRLGHFCIPTAVGIAEWHTIFSSNIITSKDYTRLGFVPPTAKGLFLSVGLLFFQFEQKNSPYLYELFCS